VITNSEGVDPGTFSALIKMISIHAANAPSDTSEELTA
jgi:hypothetical protein